MQVITSGAAAAAAPIAPGPYPLTGRGDRPASVVRVGALVAFGERRVVVIAGPCAVEDPVQMRDAARAAAEAGAMMLRGGAYKPRTSPYSFQGLERRGYELLAEAGREAGLPTVSEVVDEESLALALEYVDMLQIGSRNMQNFRLLRAVGRAGKPVLLKRGLAATVKEWLMAAEYILAEGNDQVVLCERGIRTFETATRNTLDLSAVALVKRLSHLPVIADPSHATGNPDLIAPMSCAAVAAGADGLIVEMHPRPEKALCDGKQSLTPEALADMVRQVRAVCPAVGREL
ncbi:MAG: 3-deoxy-7-phosphoheptulonate synthase [Bacillota bacterium]|nr:3-deoxy-7-phosphoheptulonate synthase [Bacillota bacterium]